MSKYKTDSNFLDKFWEYQAACSTVADCAKTYIANNFEKIEDWSMLELKVKKIGEKNYDYYHTHVEKRTSHKSIIISKLFKQINNKSKKSHNPVTSITDVVIDSIDGDFSLKINDILYVMLDDITIIDIANHIEKQLK